MKKTENQTKLNEFDGIQKLFYIIALAVFGQYGSNLFRKPQKRFLFFFSKNK